MLWPMPADNLSCQSHISAQPFAQSQEKSHDLAFDCRRGVFLFYRRYGRDRRT